MLKFNYDKYHVIIVGCGGTGSALLYFLSRFLHNMDYKDVVVTLVDGDIVEAKNVLRQSFVPADIGKNKAKVLAVRYTNILGTKMSYVDRYISTPEEIVNLVLYDRFPILVGCVDNTTARMYLNKVFHAFRSIIYLDAGNNETRGQVVFGLRYFGNRILPSAGYFFPELIAPEEGGYRLGCADIQDQTMQANFLSAHTIFSYISNILAGVESRHMTLFDAPAMEVTNKPIAQCPEFYSGGISGYSWMGAISLEH